MRKPLVQVHWSVCVNKTSYFAQVIGANMKIHSILAQTDLRSKSECV